MKDEVAFFFVRNGCLDAEKKIIDVESSNIKPLIECFE